MEPSEQDMLILLNKQYLLRLDLERKLVEHVTTFKGSDQSHMVDDDDDAELDCWTNWWTNRWTNQWIKNHHPKSSRLSKA